MKYIILRPLDSQNNRNTVDRVIYSSYTNDPHQSILIWILMSSLQWLNFL
jgi:hypothetical protein